MKDLARIYIKAGDGGNGIVHFRREKYVPKGGPDGGDGGKGGDVILVADENIENLVEFNYTRKFEVKSGGKGGEKRSTGADADNLLIKVPVGTEVYTISENLAEINLRERSNFEVMMKARRFVVDMDAHGKQIIVAFGGNGGRGNTRFKSSTNQTPREAEDGQPGEAKWLLLEQKVVADVGIIGLPNVGKSSLLKALTRANPKIAGYPFTTLEPNLGVMNVNNQAPNSNSQTNSNDLNQNDKKRRRNTLILVDVPGVVEDAYEGKGIGPWFLRHLERTKTLIHVLAPDVANIQISNPKSQTLLRSDELRKGTAIASDQIIKQLENDYRIVRKELEKYGHGLTDKEEIVVINKMELVDEKEREKMGKKQEKKIGKKVAWVSAGMGEVKELMAKIQ